MDRTVQIRRYRSVDVDALYDAVMESHAELSPWMPWCHSAYSRSDTESWVNSRSAAWELNQEWSFLIVDAADRVLGACGIHRIELRNGVAELGYWVRTSATRQGVATSATRQLCEWSFRERGLHRLEILVSAENLSSQRVAQKAGGVREGVLRERILLHGRRHDCELWSILVGRPGKDSSVCK